MPVRAALNAVYASLVVGADKKQRDEIDAELYGWNAVNDAATRALLNDGGEG